MYTDECIGSLNEPIDYQQVNATVDLFSSSSGHKSACVVCTFNESSAQACVVVIHPNLSNIGVYGTSSLVVKRLDRKVNEATGCIELLDNSAYHTVLVVFIYYNNTLGEILTSKVFLSEPEKGKL